MFCGNCGSQIPDGSNVCPNCGAAQAQNAAPQNAAPVYQAPVYQTPVGAGVPNNSNTNATIATLCGVLSIVLAIIGGIMFGVIGAGIAVVLGIVAIVMGINAKKQTNGAKGSAGFVCGILGLVFGVIFAAGCGICGLSEQANYGTKGYTCYGCVGGSCMAQNDINDGIEDMYDALEDFNW